MTNEEINKKISEIKGLKTFDGNVSGHHITEISHGVITIDYAKNWATNISDAWELFDEMKDDEDIFRGMLSLEYWKCPYDGDTYTVYRKSLGGWGAARDLKLSSDKTAPLAICMAYLANMGILKYPED